MGGVYKTTFSTETEKTRFYTNFIIVLQTIWDHVGDLWLTFGARGRLFFSFFPHRFFYCFFAGFWGPSGDPKKGSAAQGRDLWGCGKTSHSEKSIAKH